MENRKTIKSIIALLRTAAESVKNNCCTNKSLFYLKSWLRSHGHQSVKGHQKGPSRDQQSHSAFTK